MRDKPAGQTPYLVFFDAAGVRLEEIYTIFGGASGIRRLVIACAISGMRIR